LIAMAYQTPVLEHGSTRSSRWLRANRTRIALWIAVLEGALVVFDVIDVWPALLVAALVVGAYFWLGQRLRPGLARDGLWIGAVSQAMVALVPVLVLVIGTLALVAVGILAAVVLVLLLTGRR
jgi:hypothetical protein